MEDPETGEQGYFEVETAWAYPSDEILVITLETDDSTTTTLEVTAEHPIYVEAKGWIWAENLAIGDTLRRADGGTAKVLSIERVELAEPETVYNFTVAGPHTYFAAGMLVHNCLTKAGQDRLQALEEEIAIYGINTNPKTLIEREDLIALRDHKPLPSGSFDERVLEIQKERLAAQGLSTPPHVKIDIDRLTRREEPTLLANNLIVQAHQQRLQILKERQAAQGLSTPPDVLMEIEDIEMILENGISISSIRNMKELELYYHWPRLRVEAAE